MEKQKVIIIDPINKIDYEDLLFFKFANKFGEVYVGICSDDENYYLGGERNLQERAFIARSCRFITGALFYEGELPVKLLEREKPKYLIVRDNLLDEIEVEQIVKQLNIKVLNYPPEKNILDFSEKREIHSKNAMQNFAQFDDFDIF